MSEIQKCYFIKILDLSIGKWIDGSLNKNKHVLNLLRSSWFYFSLTEKTEMRGIWFKLQYKEFRLDIKSFQKIKYQILKWFVSNIIDFFES